MPVNDNSLAFSANLTLCAKLGFSYRVAQVDRVGRANGERTRKGPAVKVEQTAKLEAKNLKPGA